MSYKPLNRMPFPMASIAKSFKDFNESVKLWQEMHQKPSEAAQSLTRVAYRQARKLEERLQREFDRMTRYVEMKHYTKEGEWLKYIGEVQNDFENFSNEIVNEIHHHEPGKEEEAESLGQAINEAFSRLQKDVMATSAAHAEYGLRQANFIGTPINYNPQDYIDALTRAFNQPRELWNFDNYARSEPEEECIDIRGEAAKRITARNAKRTAPENKK